VIICLCLYILVSWPRTVNGNSNNNSLLVGMITLKQAVDVPEHKRQEMTV